MPLAGSIAAGRSVADCAVADRAAVEDRHGPAERQTAGERRPEDAGADAGNSAGRSAAETGMFRPVQVGAAGQSMGALVHRLANNGEFWSA